mmetsp:Transcript_9273/g.18263  ORF Transcript_9273/g.18263 Transcript_9273/m.18263 type:complete len:490 (+) Transcript_9273:393-1862(+)|eukprot:CAMPEP_0171499122 /NCGR_PEP_ID=MMETSP0958-20121227/8259_1 /TAXON_ID=87120 /ORGANISM="Aurantiochytrium limacinum, Strain ATCCMYA-1381" /LENGTH=489 /DNA_ID=CAMNT_0012033655 /DNA_START=474 /DNA_END=1943 /DNA_ORIENTATION=-
MTAYAEVAQNDVEEGAPLSNNAVRQKRAAARNWIVIAVITLFAGLVLMSISKDRQALDAADATATQVEARDIIHHFGNKFGDFQKVVHQTKTYEKKVKREEERAKRDRERQREKEEAMMDAYDSNNPSKEGKVVKKPKKPAQTPPTSAPTSKFTAPSESVYDFLYKHTDGSLILHSTSEEEEESIPQQDLNVITLTIQAMTRDNEDSLALVQVAIWFAKIAQAWPNDVEMTANAQQSVELLLEMDLDSLSDTTFVQSLVDFKVTDSNQDGAVVFNMEGFKQLKEQHDIIKAGLVNSDGTSDTSSDETQTVVAPPKETEEEGWKEAQIEKVVSGLLESGEITGGSSVERLRIAVQAHETLEEWRKLLTFTLAVSEARPVFEEYIREWREGKSIKGKFMTSKALKPEKKEEILENAASLLKLLEESVEQYPRVNDLLRAVFYEFLIKGSDQDDIDLDSFDDDDSSSDDSFVSPDSTSVSDGDDFTSDSESP